MGTCDDSLRIVLTIPDLGREFGGPLVTTRELADALRLLGNEVTVVGCGSAASAGEIGLPRLARFHATPIPARYAPLFKAVRRADVVHVVGLRDPVGTMAAAGAAWHRIPYVVEPAGMYPRKVRSLHLKWLFDTTLGRRLLGGAAAVVATSGFEAAELRAAGLPAHRVVVRPNGVVPGFVPLPPRGALRQRLGIPDQAVLVLVLARLAAVKGLPVLARALVSAPGVYALVSGPDSGDGTLPALRSLQTRLGLGDRLKLIPGGLWGPDKAQALADADLYCLSSEYECFGLAAAEAACAGLPVVTSARCGVVGFLDPRSTRVLDAPTAVALGEAIAAMAAEIELWKARARAAASSVRATLSWDRIALRQASVYHRVRAGAAPGPTNPAHSGGDGRA